MAIKQVWDYPEVGAKDSYLLYHEEIESLVKHIKGLKRIRFFMTFGESYLTHMKCLENVGMLGIKAVEHKGQKIVPMEFLATLLPDPASLGPRTKGKTNIGIFAKGIKDGKERTVYIYQVSDHEKCYEESSKSRSKLHHRRTSHDRSKTHARGYMARQRCLQHGRV